MIGTAVCFTWAEVQRHHPPAARCTTPKDYAWLLIASIPSVKFVLVEDVEPGTVRFTVNHGADLDRVRELIENHRPVSLLVLVELP